MKTSRVLAAGVSGVFGIVICLVIVFTAGQAGWWLAAIPVATALVGARFTDKGVYFLARLVGHM